MDSLRFGRGVSLNALLLEPLDGEEVRKTSGSAARRCWERGGKGHSFDHSPAVQRRRQARQVALRRWWNQERDDRIIRMARAGHSQRDIAKAVALSRGESSAFWSGQDLRRFRPLPTVIKFRRGSMKMDKWTLRLVTPFRPSPFGEILVQSLSLPSVVVRTYI